MAMTLSSRAEGIAPSQTLAVSSKAKAMKASGVDVISFGAGEPDFDTPAHIKQAAIDALNAGFTKYPLPVAGIPELREAISRKFQKENGLEYSPDEISVAVGGKNALYALMQALVDPGDEVIIPAPYWVSFPEMARLAGGTPVFVQAKEQAGFKLDPAELERAITDKTKLVVLNSPCNPTGSVYTPDDLGSLAQVLAGRDLYVVSDETYERLVYDGVEQRSIASFGPEMKARTIIANSLSKSYAMTGWRVGYLAGPPDVIAAVNRLQSQSTSGTASFAQKGAAAAFAGDQACVAEMRDEFDRRRRRIVERLRALPGVTCRMPAGAFYVFPNIAEWVGGEAGAASGEDRPGGRFDGSVQFATSCLEEAHVAVVPGAAFGSDAHIRLSYATSTDNIDEGMDRVERWLRDR
jgi:aspartate aminotransferase